MPYVQLILILMLPLIISGVLHMTIVSTGLLQSLAKPINQRLFGKNKTWRGLLVVPLLTIPGAQWAMELEVLLPAELRPGFADLGYVSAGLLLGLGYVLAELPNSWWKRRQGISEGMLPQEHAWLYGTIDQADSVLGCLLVYGLFFHVSALIILAVLVIATGVHLLMNLMLFSLGLRDRPC